MEGFAPLFERMAEKADDGEPQNHASATASFRGWALWPQVDRDRLTKILQQQVEQGVIHVPTLVVMASIGRLADPQDDPSKDPRIKYVSPSTLGFWQNGRYESFSPRARQSIPAMTELVAEMNRQGVTLAIGTDLANPYVFAGSSVHDEMERFANAGISAAEVLKMATVHSAQLCGVFNERGSIAVGKTASLVLLEENPLENIQAVRQVRAVWLRGRYFDRSALDELVNSVERRAQGKDLASDPTAAPELPGKVILKGKYEMKFGQFNAGSESFIISQTEDGLHSWVHSKPQGGGQVPTVVQAHFNRQGELVSASYQSLSGKGLLATYRISDGQLVGSAQSADLPAEEVQHPLRETFRISTPVYANEFMFYRDLGLEVGESTEIQSAGFGYPDWKPDSVPMQIRRGEDETLEVDGQTWQTQVYFSKFAGPMGEMNFQTWLDQDGHTLKSVLRFSFGTVTATRSLER